MKIGLCNVRRRIHTAHLLNLCVCNYRLRGINALIRSDEDLEAAAAAAASSAVTRAGMCGQQRARPRGNSRGNVKFA